MSGLLGKTRRTIPEDIESRPDVGPIRQDNPVRSKFDAPSRDVIRYSYIVILVIIAIVLVMSARMEVAILSIAIVYAGMMIAMAVRDDIRQYVNAILFFVILVAVISLFVGEGFVIYVVMVLTSLLVLMLYIWHA